MADQCKARHPGTGLRCERHEEHNHKATAAERGTHRAEVPRHDDPLSGPVRVVSW